MQRRAYVDPFTGAVPTHTSLNRPSRFLIAGCARTPALYLSAGCILIILMSHNFLGILYGTLTWLIVIGIIHRLTNKNPYWLRIQIRNASLQRQYRRSAPIWAFQTNAPLERVAFRLIPWRSSRRKAI